jgi:hypothetical protein
MNRTALGFAALIVCLGSIAFAGEDTKIILITSDEARLPATPTTSLTTRAGVTRGPQISVSSPNPDAKSVSSPIHFLVKFAARGGANIDADSVHIVYLKHPLVDLTNRLKQFIKTDGIDADPVEVPPGTHSFKIDVKDSEGRTSSSVFTFSVVP